MGLLVKGSRKERYSGERRWRQMENTTGAQKGEMVRGIRMGLNMWASVLPDFQPLIHLGPPPEGVKAHVFRAKERLREMGPDKSCPPFVRFSSSARMSWIVGSPTAPETKDFASIEWSRDVLPGRRTGPSGRIPARKTDRR